jgi:hypothetical protein
VAERTFRLYDASVLVTSRGTRKARSGRVELAWNEPDYETRNRLLDALVDRGFTIGLDPKIEQHYPSLSKYHRVGRRSTPAGDLWFHSEASPIGCKLEFYQEAVTVNSNGGRYDFDRRRKMPYLIGKAFDASLRTIRAHLTGRGISEDTKLDSPVPDPLAYFNQCWDGDYERRRGTHRFARGEDGWPSARELAKQCWGITDEHPLIEQGSVWYFRDRGGRLARGRCYGGINGMWTVIYGPGPRDHTHLARHELFQCSPSAEPRRISRSGRARLERELRQAVSAQHFERAIVLRDQLTRAA